MAGDQTYVDRDFAVASQSGDFAVLQGGEQFGLQADREVAYFIQE